MPCGMNARAYLDGIRAYKFTDTNSRMRGEDLSFFHLLVYSPNAPVSGEKIQKNQNTRDGCYRE